MRLEGFENVTVFLEPTQAILEYVRVLVIKYKKVAGQLGILVKDLAKSAADCPQGVKPCVVEGCRISKAWLQVREHLSPVGQNSMTSLTIYAVVVLQHLPVVVSQTNEFVSCMRPGLLRPIWLLLSD